MSNNEGCIFASDILAQKMEADVEELFNSLEQVHDLRRKMKEVLDRCFAILPCQEIDELRLQLIDFEREIRCLQQEVNNSIITSRQKNEIDYDIPIQYPVASKYDDVDEEEDIMRALERGEAERYGF